MAHATTPRPILPAGQPATAPGRKAPSRLKHLLSILGPGIITGAADDDPSGIATYSITGAQLGTSLLWTSLLTWPMMAMVQLMCARVGMVTGAGLAHSLKRKFPRSVIAVVGLALLAANTINIGADLAGMADAATDLLGGSYALFALFFGAAIACVVVFFRYAQFAAVMKWLVLSLGAYIVTAFISKPDWSSVWHDLLVPHWPKNRTEWSTLVALLGTTISPYLFFWQSSVEVEEEKCLGRDCLPARAGATPTELANRRIDVWAGAFFSNLVMFFVILSCTMTLHRTGMTNIQTSHDAAAALRPVAGRFATMLYTAGIIGVGLLAIPTLAGSSAYALAETFNWRQGLDEKFNTAPKFYRVVLGSIAGGTLFALLRISPVRALFWAAVINGVLAPFVLVGLVAVARDHKLMHGQPSSPLSRLIVSSTALAMGAAAIVMCVV